jgi:lambda repressor-like predicted transcriptional regulator
MGDDWSGLLARLTSSIDLDALAKETRALVRRRGVPDAASLLRLALARGPGGMSLREAAGWAHLAGVAQLTDASLNDRLHQSCDFLAAIVANLLKKKVGGVLPRWPGRYLRVSDGSCISKPASRGTDWRVHGVYDLGAGGFSHLELTDKHGGEALNRGAGIAGEIRIADRGYSAAKAICGYMASVTQEQGADYVVRLRWSSLRLRKPCGEKFDLIAHLRKMPKEQATDEVRVMIEGAGAAMPTRIVIARKPPQAAQATCERLKREASKSGKKLDDRSLIAAEFVMLATSLAQDAYPVAEILAMYRLRWQIELAFKRLKSLLRIDCLPAKTEKGGRSWIYAHLILAIATDECSQDFLESSPWGSD